MKWRSLEESAARGEARSLCEIYAERKTLIAKYVPADVQAIHARVVEELKQSGAADRALQVGSKVQPFELLNQDGIALNSADLLRQGPLVICFIRGRWCPFCVGDGIHEWDFFRVAKTRRFARFHLAANGAPVLSDG